MVIVTEPLLQKPMPFFAPVRHCGRPKVITKLVWKTSESPLPVGPTGVSVGVGTKPSMRGETHSRQFTPRTASRDVSMQRTFGESLRICLQPWKVPMCSLVPLMTHSSRTIRGITVPCSSRWLRSFASTTHFAHGGFWAVPGSLLLGYPLENSNVETFLSVSLARLSLSLLSAGASATSAAGALLACLPCFIDGATVATAKALAALCAHRGARAATQLSTRAHRRSRRCWKRDAAIVEGVRRNGALSRRKR
mmetsp:Transcript_71488/g.209965  ORF Transcript_71488/g.209965 Transcript_71488/m.209965 type:complete len:251 (-) Transcript_71488:66-818(-)